MVRKSNKKASPASASRDRLAQSAGSGVVVCDTAMYDPPAEGGMKVLCFNEKVQLERVRVLSFSCLYKMLEH